MSKRDIASLACKVIAVFLILQAISVMANLLSFYVSLPVIMGMAEREPLVNMIFPYIFFLISGILLWIFSDKLAILMVKEEEDSETAASMSIKGTDIERILFSVLGLYFMAHSLPYIVSMLTNMYWMSDIPQASMRVLPDALGKITQFIMGLAIFLGSQGLVGLLKTVRSIGIKQAEEANQENSSINQEGEDRNKDEQTESKN